MPEPLFFLYLLKAKLLMRLQKIFKRQLMFTLHFCKFRRLGKSNEKAAKRGFFERLILPVLAEYSKRLPQNS